MEKLQSYIIKIGFLIIFIIAGRVIAQAQNPVLVEFEVADSTIIEPVTNEKIHLIKVLISTDTTLSRSIEVEVEPDLSSTATFEDYELVEDKVVLSNSIRDGYIHVKIKADSKNEDDEKIILKIKEKPAEYLIPTEGDNPKYKHTLTIENAVKITKPGSLLIGTNFDFIDGAGASKLYYDLNLSFQSLHNFNLFGRESSFGLETGLKRNRSSSQESDTTISEPLSTLRLLNGSSNLADTIRVIRDIYNVDEYQLDYLSFYLQPTVRFTSNFKENNLFIIGHTEILQKKYTAHLEEEPFHSDTLAILRENRSISTREIDNPLRISTIQFNLGIGLMFLHQSQDLRASVKWITGTQNSQYGREPFYLINFDVTEQKTLIQLGAEIRSGDNIRPFTENRNFSIYIAKKFPLSKIAELFSSE